MNQLRAAAETLRDAGYSYAMIQEELGVAKGTMSYWFKDRPFQPNDQVVERIKHGPLKSGARRHNKRVEDIAAMRQAGVEEVGKLSKRDLWLLGIGLYIGEGAKTTESICISNSDPAVIVLAIRWLQEACGLSPENIVIRLHLYPDSDEEASIAYWQTITQLSRSNFYRSHIDRRLDKKRSAQGKLPYGTAHVRVVAKGDAAKGVSLYRRIGGWMAGALNQV